MTTSERFWRSLASAWRCRICCRRFEGRRRQREYVRSLVTYHAWTAPGEVPRIPELWQHSFGAKLLVSPDKLPISIFASSISKKKGAERHRPVAPSAADLKQPPDDIANTTG